jgi:DNA-directed RNA polymerase specialized sigma24 family protein
MYDEELKRISLMVIPHFREDVLQEMRIKTWEIIEQHPGEDVKGLVMFAARRTARRVVMRAIEGQNPWTGSPSLVGKTRGEVEVVHGDAEIDGVPLWDTVPAEFISEELGSDAEIISVVSSLDKLDRTHVYLKFWEGLTDRQIGDRLGTSKNAEHKRWTRIKPKLREALSV